MANVVFAADAFTVPVRQQRSHRQVEHGWSANASDAAELVPKVP